MFKPTKKERKLLRTVINLRGPAQQVAKAAEELSELSHILSKTLADILNGDGPGDLGARLYRHPNTARIHGEMADVQIMLHQLESIFGEAPQDCFDSKISTLRSKMESRTWKGRGPGYVFQAANVDEVIGELHGLNLDMRRLARQVNGAAGPHLEMRAGDLITGDVIVHNGQPVAVTAVGTVRAGWIPVTCEGLLQPLVLPVDRMFQIVDATQPEGQADTRLVPVSHLVKGMKVRTPGGDVHEVGSCRPCGPITGPTGTYRIIFADFHTRELGGDHQVQVLLPVTDPAAE